MDKLFIMLMGVFCLVIAGAALWTGEVKWRGGKVAAVRSENPVHFWAHILVYLGVAAVIFLVGLSK